MHPAYQGLSVSHARKSKKCYVLNVKGEGAHYCLNKGGAHRRASIYFIVNRNGVCQKCFAGRGAEGGCTTFRSAPAPIEPALQDALFGAGPRSSPASSAMGLPGPPPPRGVTEAGAFTNYRLCKDTLKPVAVVPFPKPSSVWAPPSTT